MTYDHSSEISSFFKNINALQKIEKVKYIPKLSVLVTLLVKLLKTNTQMIKMLVKNTYLKIYLVLKGLLYVNCKRNKDNYSNNSKDFDRNK